MTQNYEEIIMTKL